MDRDMREIKTLLVLGIGTWSIGDKLGDGIIASIQGNQDMSTAPYFMALDKDNEVLAVWENVQTMAVFGKL
jgi:hypothetical protein